MKQEKQPTGPLRSRREVIALLGASGAAWLLTDSGNLRRAVAGAHRPSCVVRPEQTEGPFFVDERLNRTDIRTDSADGRMKPGTPLALTQQVSRLAAGDCQPLPDAQVDLWQCDALGVYSDVRNSAMKSGGQTFLRGYQITDGRGAVEFVTIYPGWYPGRTVHIHFKIRTALMAGRILDFTSQLYFDDELTDRVHAVLPYTAQGARTVRNEHDRIFRTEGDQLMLAPTTMVDGYAASFAIGLQIP